MGKKTKGINNKNQGGIDFIRAKKKVGRKIKKAANATDTTVRAKRITLPGQVLGAEGKGAAVTQRGLSLPELLGQCAHYSERVRKDALDGIAELLQAHPEALVASAATVVEKVAERLVDREKVARDAARAALRLGVLPALGPRGLAPFAPALILHVGAALTHVHPAVRRDAPGALDAILDVAPDLVAANDPAATLRHLAELLRRGDDAASSALVAETDKARAENATSDDRDDYGARSDARGGLSRAFGDMTASRVGPQAPDARLRLLTSCRRFLEVLARGTGGRATGGGPRSTDRRIDRRSRRRRRGGGAPTSVVTLGPMTRSAVRPTAAATDHPPDRRARGVSRGTPPARSTARARRSTRTERPARRPRRDQPRRRLRAAARRTPEVPRFRSVRFLRRRRSSRRCSSRRGMRRRRRSRTRGERRARCACEA